MNITELIMRGFLKIILGLVVFGALAACQDTPDGEAVPVAAIVPDEGWVVQTSKDQITDEISKAILLRAEVEGWPLTSPVLLLSCQNDGVVYSILSWPVRLKTTQETNGLWMSSAQIRLDDLPFETEDLIGGRSGDEVLFWSGDDLDRLASARVLKLRLSHYYEGAGLAVFKIPNDQDGYQAFKSDCQLLRNQ